MVARSIWPEGGRARRSGFAVFCLVAGFAGMAGAQVDRGPRPGEAGAGDAYDGLTPTEKDFFTAARARFSEVDSVSGAVTGENGVGLGPTFNGNSCAQCHAQPAVGGTSPHPTLGQVLRENPQVGLATLDRVSGGEQRVPSFIHRNGPVREARFIRNANGRKDGGVHGLYTIAGRIDAVGCNLAQPDFAAELARGNVIFRIPTPVFGGGLIESVTDEALVANLTDNAAEKAALGIFGVLNRNGNDGTVTRFGWKAQNKSLLIFAGEAYNVEQGVSNELFPNERATAPGCRFNPSPEDSSNITNPIGGGLTGTASEMSSDTVNFAAFMRLSAAPVPKDNPTSGEQHGKELFSIVGCAHCHTPTLTTGESPFGGMSGIAIHPYSDFALHHMGRRLADYVDQGNAGPDQFRTAPLWGAGQRIFFLHDGRATPDNGGLVRAILAHESSNPSCSPGQLFAPDGTACHSEANAVIQRFRARSASDRQDILDFLRSL